MGGFGMDKLNFPEYKFRFSRSADQKVYIFDPYRKKELLLTPEEWVRQNVLRYLVEEKSYPGGLISTEAGIKINRLMRRYDALIYGHHGQAMMLVECKAPGVKINQGVFDQVIAYNRRIKADYLLITNGLKHFCCRIDPVKGKYNFLEEIPDFTELRAK